MGFHYSGSYPMVFQHSGAQDFDLGHWGRVSLQTQVACQVVTPRLVFQHSDGTSNDRSCRVLRFLCVTERLRTLALIDTPLSRELNGAACCIRVTQMSEVLQLKSRNRSRLAFSRKPSRAQDLEPSRARGRDPHHHLHLGHRLVHRGPPCLSHPDPGRGQGDQSG